MTEIIKLIYVSPSDAEGVKPFYADENGVSKIKSSELVAERKELLRAKGGLREVAEERLKRKQRKIDDRFDPSDKDYYAECRKVLAETREAAAKRLLNIAPGSDVEIQLF